MVDLRKLYGTRVLIFEPPKEVMDLCGHSDIPDLFTAYFMDSRLWHALPSKSTVGQ